MKNPKALGWTMFFALAVTTALAGCRRSEVGVVRTAASANFATSASPATIEIYHGTGTVVSINPKLPSVELDHQEIIGLMPAMTMEFYVKDVSMLTGLKRGDRVEFTLHNGVGGIKITEIHKL